MEASIQREFGADAHRFPAGSCSGVKEFGFAESQQATLFPRKKDARAGKVPASERNGDGAEHFVGIGGDAGCKIIGEGEVAVPRDAGVDGTVRDLEQRFCKGISEQLIPFFFLRPLFLNHASGRDAVALREVSARKPARKRGQAAAAIIAALSVERARLGKKVCIPTALPRSSKAVRSCALAATPPETRIVEAPDCSAAAKVRSRRSRTTVF